MRKQTRFGIANYGLLIAVILSLLLPAVAGAQAPFVLCSPSGCTLNDLLAVPVRIYNFLLGFAGIVALGVIIWGGARMLAFHLAEAPEQELNNAKMTITRGIFGLLIIATAYLAVNLILYVFLGLSRGSGVGQILQRFGL